jgi:hypothetical protein
MKQGKSLEIVIQICWVLGLLVGLPILFVVTMLLLRYLLIQVHSDLVNADSPLSYLFLGLVVVIVLLCAYIYRLRRQLEEVASSLARLSDRP